MIKLGNNIIDMKLGSQTIQKVYFENDLIYEPPIKFEDPVAEQICLQNFDKKNQGFLTRSDLAKVDFNQNTNSIFRNTQITKFNEFQYFTGITYWVTNLFTGSTLLQEITMPSITLKYHGDIYTNKSLFQGCEKLTRINWNNCHIDSNAQSNKYRGLFYGCKALDWSDDILPPGCDEIGDCMFQNTGCTKIIIPEGIEYCGNQSELSKLEYIEFPSTLTTLNASDWFRNIKGANQNKIVGVFKGLTPPTLSSISGYHDSDMKCYVPDESYDAYVSAFASMSRFKIFKLSTLPEEYRNWGTLLPDYASYFEGE